MSNSAINTQVAQLKIGNVQNQADNSAVYSGGIWSLKNSTALTSVTITDAGNVGIGTASPADILHLGGATNKQVRIDTADSVPVYIGGYNEILNLAVNRRTVDGAIGNVNRSAAFISLNGPSGGSNITFNTAAANNTQPTERMRIDSSGNVGIGTASPAVKLQVEGGIRIPASTGFQLGNGSTYFYTTAASNGDFVFGTSSTDRMRITTTGTIFSLPTYNNSSGAAANMAVTASGEFVRSSSALKYKEDITPISHGLQTVLSMQPIEYKSKCEADKDASHKFIGFVADWEEANLPALVQKNGEGEVEGFSYDRLTAVLCKAIQELSAKVEEQSSRIDAQAEEIKALKAK